jgi:hypothetical protein
VAVTVFAVGMGLFSEHNSFPLYYHTDEPGKVLQVIHRRKNFHHPTLLLTTATVARGASLHGGAEDDPQRVVEVARLVVAAFAAASAALLALLAARIHGIWAGLAAGLLAVTHPLLYELAHYFKEDPTLLFGIVACALAAHRLSTRRDASSLVLLGVAAGVAAAGKYVGTALVPVAALIGANVGGGTARERWRRARKVLGIALLTWLALDYRIFRSPALIVPQSLGEEMSKAFLGKHGLLKETPHAFYFAVQDSYGGPWVPVLAALWLAFAIWRPKKVSVAEWLLAGLASVFLVVFSFTPKTSTRYYLPIAVTLCYLAAAGAFHWAALVSARGKRSRIAIIVAVVLCVGAAWGQWGDTREVRLAFQRDDRADLVKAVEALPPTAIVAQDEAAGLPEPERRWEHKGRTALKQQILGAAQVADLGSLAELRARGVTHLALCEKTYGPYFATDRIIEDQSFVKARRAFYQTALERGRVLREWKQGRIVYLQPGLVLVDVSGLDPVGVGRGPASKQVSR